MKKIRNEAHQTRFLMASESHRSIQKTILVLVLCSYRKAAHLDILIVQMRLGIGVELTTKYDNRHETLLRWGLGHRGLSWPLTSMVREIRTGHRTRRGARAIYGAWRPRGGPGEGHEPSMGSHRIGLGTGGGFALRHCGAAEREIERERETRSR